MSFLKAAKEIERTAAENEIKKFCANLEQEMILAVREKRFCQFDKKHLWSDLKYICTRDPKRYGAQFTVTIHTA